MATDFSINALLNLPSKESRNVPEQKIKMELPISGTERFFPSAGQIDSNGECFSVGMILLCCYKFQQLMHM
jgi:hypothetical protein